jgi:uncharacterized damage-inducible protein DinB
MLESTAMNARELLVDTVVHIPPPNALAGLSPEDADRRVPGAPHSISEIVAHVCFWQEWFAGRCEGQHLPMVTKAALGWPAVSPGAWPELQARFLAGLDRVVALGNTDDVDRPVDPPIEFPLLAHYTVRDAIVHMGAHNAHHLGQIILLRQIIGAWPPPAGSYTW